MSTNSENPQKKRIVTSGDCFLSLAAEEGIPFDRLIEVPDNKKLLEKRKNEPGILMTGDVVTCPAIETKEWEVSTEQRHRFEKAESWARLRIKLEELGEPCKNEPYFVMIEKKRFEGIVSTTNKEGLVEVRIPAKTKFAIIIIGEGDREREYEVELGTIDPIDTPEGIHSRLQNLGFYEGEVATPYDEDSKESFSEYLDTIGKHDRSVEEQGNSENQTSLEETYGS